MPCVLYTAFLRYVSKVIINNLNEIPKIFLLSTYTSGILYLTINRCFCNRQKMTEMFCGFHSMCIQSEKGKHIGYSYLLPLVLKF
jgi:hypothetical protein